MKSSVTMFSLALLGAGLAALPAAASPVTVSGKANPYFAGQTGDTIADAVAGGANLFGDGVANVPPFVDVSGACFLDITATSVGGGWHLGCCGTTDPDGEPPYGFQSGNGTNPNYEVFGIARVLGFYDPGMPAQGGIKVGTLLGVFTNGAAPTLPAPSNIEFGDDMTMPALQQVFAIGSSLSGVTVPDSATHLHLGYADGFRWRDNGGAVSVSITPSGPPPTADCSYTQLTNIGDVAQVSLTGVGSSECPDDLTYAWSVRDAAGIEVATGTEAVLDVILDYGQYEATLTVTGSFGSNDSVCQLNIDPASLTVFDYKKIEVKFDDDDGDEDKIKVSGEIVLPMGVDYAELDAMALVTLEAAGFDFLGVGIAPIAFEEHGGNGHHWKYRDDDSTLGIRKLDIDWKGARFKYKEGNVPVEFDSELISSSETVLEMKYKMNDAGGPFTVDIDGTLLDVDADGLVTSSDPSVSIEVEKDGEEVLLTLSFAVTESSTITFGGALAGTVNASDHYTNSLGKFKLEARSTSWPVTPDAEDRTVNMSILTGALYPGEIGAGPVELEAHNDKWKAQD